jgi:hypothetical protein
MRVATTLGTCVGALVLALALSGCGRDPVGGQEGELCGADRDCAAGYVCNRSVCQFLAGRHGGGQPRAGLFFVVLELDTWTGPADSGQLGQLGQFVSDLSTILSPYYGAHAMSDTQLKFGLVDRDADPLLLDEEATVTALLMRRSGRLYLADQERLLVPVFYRDDSVALAFDMPLRRATIRLDFDDGFQPGARGAVSLTGALRADEAQELTVYQSGQTFTIYDVLRGEPLDADTDFDSLSDAWTMSWIGRAYAF